MVNYSRNSRYICQPCPSIIQKPQDNFSKMPSFGFTLFIKPFAILHTSSAAVQLPHSLHEPIHSMGASEHHEIYVVFSIAFDQISRNVSKWISDRNSKNASAEAKNKRWIGIPYLLQFHLFEKVIKLKRFWTAPHLLDSMIYYLTDGVIYYIKRKTEQTVHAGV